MENVTGYTFDVKDCEVNYISLIEDGFMPVEDEE